ncbi:MAG: 2-oxoacid:acceptor oxidoreductase family protein [Candidatus Thorarchaeota archaeon]
MASIEEKPINIALVGLGGQGIITLSKLILSTVNMMGKKACMNEIHGLSQRGGSVQTFLRLNVQDSPLFASMDTNFVIGLEKLETLRYLYQAKTAKPIVILADFYDIRNNSLLGLEVFPDEEEINTEIRKYAQKLYLFDVTKFYRLFKPKFKPLNVAMLSVVTKIPELDIDRNLAKKNLLTYLGNDPILKQINQLAFQVSGRWIKEEEIKN